MGNSQGSDTIGELFEMYAVNQARVRPQIRPYVPDDKHAEFQGYSNDFTGEENSQAMIAEKEASILSKAGKDAAQEIDPLAIIGITNMTVAEAESQFTQAELTQIKKEFNKNSKDQIMGKRKLIEYFRILDISDSYLTSQLFTVIKNSQRLTQPIDYQKFICFIAIISKGSRIQKLLLIFSIFGKGIPDRIMDGNFDANDDYESGELFQNDPEVISPAKKKNKMAAFDNESEDEDEEVDLYEPRVSREDIKLHISGTILSMVGVQYENVDVETLKQSLISSEESLIDEALDMLVDDIWRDYAKSNAEDGLSFEEWCKWFTSLEGINEMLMTPSQLQQKNKINALLQNHH